MPSKKVDVVRRHDRQRRIGDVGGWEHRRVARRGHLRNRVGEVAVSHLQVVYQAVDRERGTGVPEPGAVLGIVDPSAGNGSSRWLTS